MHFHNVATLVVAAPFAIGLAAYAVGALRRLVHFARTGEEL